MNKHDLWLIAAEGMGRSCRVTDQNTPKPSQQLFLMVNGEVSDGQASRASVWDAVEAAHGPFPVGAREAQSFETEDGTVRMERAQQDGADAWALRYITPEHSAPARSWNIEFSSLIGPEQSGFGCRMTLLTDTGSFNAELTTPVALKIVCAGLSFGAAGVRLMPAPQMLDDVTAFLRELTARERFWTVIVVSEAEAHRLPGGAQSLQSALAGAANVYVLPVRREIEFAAAVGYDLNLPARAARLFRPGFDPFWPEPTRHPALPLMLPADEDYNASAAITAIAFKNTLNTGPWRRDLPGLLSIRQMASQALSEAASVSGDSATRIEALEDLVETERRNAEEAVALAIQTDEERQRAQEALATEQAASHALSARIERLEARLARLGDTIDGQAPTEYSAVGAWAAQSLSGKLRLTPRAEKGLRDARYEKIEDVIAGLTLLAGPYRDMKRGRSDPHLFTEVCREAGFEETRSMSKVAAGQQGETYFVRHGGARHLMDRHLKKGTSKDPRHCLRIYFFWDAAQEIVVVGSLPAHLDTANK